MGRAPFPPPLEFSIVPLLPPMPEAAVPPGYLWSWSARAFVSPSADLPARLGAYKPFLNFPALCYLRGKIAFLREEATARCSCPPSRPRAPAEVAPPCGLRLPGAAPGSAGSKMGSGSAGAGGSAAAPERGCEGERQAPWLDRRALSPLGMSPSPVQPLAGSGRAGGQLVNRRLP